MRSRIRALAETLTDQATPLRLTLLVLLLRPAGDGAIRGLTWLIAGLALVVPSIGRSAAAWGAIAVLVLARLTADWPLADNHIYLLAYWSAGLALCLLLPSSYDAVAAMSRWLVGTTFLCAVLWKSVLAPEFLDGRFFRVTLITDERFEGLARTVGGLSDADVRMNRLALVALPAGAEVLDGPRLNEPPALRTAGVVLTWGGLLLELAIAAAFLSRRPAVLHRARHVLLIVFVSITYAVAPVAGFGWLLAAMGLAQCGRDAPGTRLGYLASFVLVVLYAETPLPAALLFGRG